MDGKILKHNGILKVLEFEIVSDYISSIRLCVFRMISILLENELTDIAKQLQKNMFINLNVPQKSIYNVLFNTPFDFQSENVSDVYGEGITEIISEIDRGVKKAIKFGNPMYKAVEDYFKKSANKIKYVIFTEGKFKDELKVIIDSFCMTDIDVNVISTITEYKDLESFDELIFIGVIRSDEYTSMPNFLLRNVKYSRLVQFKWIGQRNDNVAFLNPISRLKFIYTSEVRESYDLISCFNKKQFICNGDDLSSREINNIDEFDVYRKLIPDDFPALCFKFLNDESVFYPPNSKIIYICNKSQRLSVHYDKAVNISSLDSEEIYIVSFDIPCNHSQNHDVSNRKYQDIWKNILLEQDFSSISGELERSGVKLKNLDNCISEWCDFSDKVVKAPQEKDNFFSLMRCLRSDIIAYVDIDDFDLWTESAWNEVLHSRGEAISDGLQYSYEFEENVYKAIKKLVKSYSKSSTSWLLEGFNIYANSESCEIKLNNLKNIDFGYDVPKNMLRKIITIQESSFYR